VVRDDEVEHHKKVDDVVLDDEVEHHKEADGEVEDDGVKDDGVKDDGVVDDGVEDGVEVDGNHSFLYVILKEEVLFFQLVFLYMVLHEPQLQ